MADLMKKKLDFGGGGLSSTTRGLSQLSKDKKINEMYEMIQRIVSKLEGEEDFDANSLEMGEEGLEMENEGEMLQDEGMELEGESPLMGLMPSDEEEEEYHANLDESEDMENAGIMADGEIDLSDEQIMEEGEADQDRIQEDHKMDHGYAPDSDDDEDKEDKEDDDDEEDKED